MRSYLAEHWPEYLMEAAGLGMFMVSAGLFGTILEYPGSPIHFAIPSAALRRILMGLAMGVTAVLIIYSPWGRRSGAHINPAVTLAFTRLGKVRPWDATFYVLAQFIGAVGGVMLILVLFGRAFADPPVNTVATVPGPAGYELAFAAEFAISFVLMLVILVATNTPRIARFTGLFAGVLVAVYIAIEAPLSGMSMNPARTLGSALPGNVWSGLWIYFVAPTAGMLLASEIFVRARGAHRVICAKLHHDHTQRCIFHCGYGAPSVRSREPAPAVGLPQESSA